MIPLPEAFLSQMRPLLGDEFDDFIDALAQAPTLALRINPLRANALELAAPFIDENVPWEALGHYLRAELRPGAGISHFAGAFYLQEASAMTAAAVLDPKPSERVLDLCAAPGGKSTQLAARMRGEGMLISNEPEPARAKTLASNLERMGVSNAAVVCAYPAALASRWKGYFDAILCDAPCSGEGMFRRAPESRAEWQPSSPAGCARRQAEILDHAATLLRPGGRLVYSTCTFNSQENEQSIANFLERHPEFVPEDFFLPGLGQSQHGMIRVWPQRVRGDGHFAAKLRKLGEAEAIKSPSLRPDRELLSLLKKLEASACTLPEAWKARALRQGDRVIALPEGCPDMRGLKVISPGLYLMRIGRSHVEPEHALAMAMQPKDALRSIELNDFQAQRYLMGEALPCEHEPGWTLVLWRGLALGWGKCSLDLLKNHLPMRKTTPIPAY